MEDKKEIFYTIEIACEKVEDISIHYSEAEREAYISGYGTAVGLFGGDGNAIPLEWIDELDEENKKIALSMIEDIEKE